MTMYASFIKEFGTAKAIQHSCAQMSQPGEWEVSKTRLIGSVVAACLLKFIGWRFPNRLPHSNLVLNLAAVGIALLGLATSMRRGEDVEVEDVCNKARDLMHPVQERLTLLAFLIHQYVVQEFNRTQKTGKSARLDVHATTSWEKLSQWNKEYHVSCFIKQMLKEKAKGLGHNFVLEEMAKFKIPFESSLEQTEQAYKTLFGEISESWEAIDHFTSITLENVENVPQGVLKALQKTQKMAACLFYGQTTRTVSQQYRISYDWCQFMAVPLPDSTWTQDGN